MQTSCKYLIVGGGASGLTFANFIKSDDYIVLEKEAELGGYCRTIYSKDYIWDYAGHFFHFANDAIKSFFEQRIDQDNLVYRKKETRIFYGDRVIDFPFQTNIHQLPQQEFIDCLYDLYFREEKEAYSSFLEMLYGKFGKSITEKFLKPYNEKLYACDLNMLDQDAMGRFFPYANLDQIIRNFKQEYAGSYNSSFLYPKKGAKIFIDALAADIPEKNVSLNEFVISIDTNNKIATTNKRTIRYDYLVNSMPFDRLLKATEIEHYAEAARNLSYNKVLVFNLGFDKKSAFNDIHWAYFPEAKYNFYRVGFYDNILGSDKLSMYVEIGYAKDDPIDVESQLIETLGSLKLAGIIDDHVLQAHCAIVMDPAYVHVDSRLNDLKRSIMQELSEKNIFSIGRYGDWKYCSIEDSMLDAVNLASKLN